MKFHELIHAVPWTMVETFLHDYYNASQSTIDNHKVAYDKMLVQEPVTNSMILSVTEHEEDGETYVDVSGSDGTRNRDMPDFKYLKIPDNDPRADALVWFALEFRPWQEWLGMTIDPETLKKFSPEKIISHCLWEMTFIGYDEEKIQGEHDHLEGMVEEIKAGKARGKQYSSVKEMMDDIKRRIDENPEHDGQVNEKSGEGESRKTDQSSDLSADPGTGSGNPSGLPEDNGNQTGQGDQEETPDAP